MENESKYSEEKKVKAKNLLRRLLTADDWIRLKHHRGELSEKEAARIGGNIAIVLDGIMLEALRVKNLSEAVVPVLIDKVKNGLGNPLPYVHFLQMLSLKHQITVGDTVPDPDDIYRSVQTLREEIDLRNIEERWAELREKDKKPTKQLGEKREDNPMFG